MKSIHVILGAAFLAGGCMGPAPKAPVHWTIETRATAVTAAATAKWGVARLSGVSVRAPYDGQKLAVLRANGSIAFDPCNLFAASPAALMRGAARDVLAGSGLFARVVPSASSAAADCTVEIGVTRLALDCRTPGTRTAACELSVLLLKGREIVGTAQGAGAVPVAGGNYSAAFSSAFTAALATALKEL